MKEIVWSIYAWQNDVNGKYYVGQTRQMPHQRRDSHLSHLSKAHKGKAKSAETRERMRIASRKREAKKREERRNNPLQIKLFE